MEFIWGGWYSKAEVRRKRRVVVVVVVGLNIFLPRLHFLLCPSHPHTRKLQKGWQGFSSISCEFCSQTVRFKRRREWREFSEQKTQSVEPFSWKVLPLTLCCFVDMCACVFKLKVQLQHTLQFNPWPPSLNNCNSTAVQPWIYFLIIPQTHDNHKKLLKIHAL